VVDLDISEYKDEFINEAKEELQDMNEALLDLEHDPGNMDLLNRVFRSAHTLKGSSATMGYTNISELTHKMENVLDAIRNQRLMITSDVLDLIFESFDALEVLVEDIDHDRESEIDVNWFIERLNKLTEDPGKFVPDHIPHIELTEVDKRAVDLAISEGLEILQVKVTVEEDCALKGVRAFMVIKKLRERGAIVASIPQAEAIENGEFENEFILLLEVKQGSIECAKLSSELAAMNEIASVVVEEFVREDVLSPHLHPRTGSSTPSAATNKVGVEKVQSVRVNIDKLDALVNLVGELVISKIRLKDLGAAHQLKDLEETIATVDRLVTDLKSEVMEMRMVPVRQIFNKFPRMVRDLARKEEKVINFEMEGGEIELDRTVLDEIGEPLLHLIRNCVDHGIESPDLRRASGKSAEGQVRLVASREKNQVLIEVIDDGAGIDPEMMRDAVVKKGLMTRDDAEKLTDQEAQELIFMPGLSTAETVSEVSGRGVGLNVVKTKIESFGGSVILNSKVGEGTRVALRLPLTMAIVQAMLVEVGDQTFAIPINNIVEVASIPLEDVSMIGSLEITTLRGNVLPLIRMHDLMQIPDTRAKDLNVVVVERNSKQVGLVVDNITAQQEVVIKMMGGILKGVKGFAGATILGDGRVILIVDIGTLI